MGDFKKSHSIKTIATGFPVIAQGLQVLGYTTDKSSFVVSAVCALLSVWGNFASEKSSDLMLEFKKNKDKIINEITQSDKFISVFLEIFDRNIKESNEEKRQMLKNYILNIAVGVERDFNEHTKLIYTLNNITVEEVLILKLWGDDGCINQNAMYKSIGRITVNEIARCVLDKRSKYNNHQLNEKEKYIFDLSQEKDKLNQILLSLGYKGLLYVLSEDNFGSGEEARVKDITDFGKLFLRFIRK